MSDTWFGVKERIFLSLTISDTPHYENVPFEIPSSWAWCKLENITVLIEDCPHTTAKDEGEGYPLVRTPNIGEGQLLLDGVHRVSKEVYDKRNIRAVPQVNDIIYAREAPAGNAAVIRENEQVCLGQRTVLIRPMDTLIDSVWLTYAMLAPYSRNHLTSKATGSTVTHVNMTSIRPFDLPLPPISEQHRIVAEIRRWFALIDQIEQGKADLQTTIKQAKSKILDLAIHGKLVPQDPNDEPAIELLKRINPDFTSCDNGHYPNRWQQTILGELFYHNTGKALNSSNKEGVMRNYLTTSNVYWNKFDFTVIKQMPFKESELDKYTVTKGDLLVCEGGDIGRSAIWNYDYDICIQNHIHRLRPKIDLCVLFYYYALAYLKENNLIGGKGIGLLGLSSNALHKIEIPLPPLVEQQRIALKIEELFSVLDNIQNAFRSVNEYTSKG